MKVRDLLKQLREYDGEVELIVAFWDKETVEGYMDIDAPDLTDEQWKDVVAEYEDGEWHWQSSAAEDFVEIAQQVISDYESEG